MKRICDDLKNLSNKEKAKVLQRFFKTGKGEYGDGDIFLGVVVPEQRKVAKKYYNEIDFDILDKLLSSKIHEERLVAVLILVEKFEKSNKERKKIFDFYLKHAELGNINNWDLVDLSAPKIVGDFLLDKKDKKVLYDLARSENLWEKRISIVSCFAFIKENDFSDTLKISKILLKDKHDLINKAVGWMLREVGKINEKVLKYFLKENYDDLSRTTLRYAIERFPEDLRKKFLKGEI